MKEEPIVAASGYVRGAFSCFPINTPWKLFSVLIFFFIEVKLSYNVVLISAV